MITGERMGGKERRQTLVTRVHSGRVGFGQRGDTMAEGEAGVRLCRLTKRKTPLSREAKDKPDHR